MNVYYLAIRLTGVSVELMNLMFDVDRLLSHTCRYEVLGKYVSGLELMILFIIVKHLNYNLLLFALDRFFTCRVRVKLKSDTKIHFYLFEI